MSFGNPWRNLNPYELHKTLINEYFLTEKKKVLLLKRDTSKDKRDIDVIRENHQFLWDEDDDGNVSWEKKLAKKYYDKLYKEYCVVDLSRYKENKVGLRWRTKEELIEGKGQFSCGGKRCGGGEDLRTWEVNFGYVEHGIKKNALVKLRLCPDCSHKLNYHHKRKEIKRLKRNHLEEEKKEEEDKEGGERRRKKMKKNNNDDHGEEQNSGSIELKSEFVEGGSRVGGGSGSEDVWRQSHVEEEEERVSREEEFDKYLDQLFL